ncbi:MAG TPA: hypothetical protein VGQ71_10215, partial [Terriglobales bacterium]|nr:hypothetical protein [Terriglobales bacterium]
MYRRNKRPLRTIYLEPTDSFGSAAVYRSNAEKASIIADLQDCSEGDITRQRESGELDFGS